MAVLANPSKRWHIVLRCTICGPLGLLFLYWPHHLHMRQALIKHYNNIKTSVMEYILRSNITEMGTCLNYLDLVYDVTIDLIGIIFMICFNQQHCMIICLNLIYNFYSFR